MLTLYQIPIGFSVEGEIPSAQQIQEAVVNWPWLIASFLIAVIIIAALYFSARFIKKTIEINNAFNNKIFLVSVPKESPEKEDQKKPIKEQLVVMERFFDTIAGMKAQKGLKYNFMGRTDYFSFEIVVNKDGLISFYVVVPRNLEEFFEKQIHAQFPQAQIDLMPDYTIFSPQGFIESAVMTLKNYSAFPIATYQKMETDPLVGIINSLSKFQRGDGASVQIIARSAHPEWHSYGKKIAQEMQQGKKLKDAVNKVYGSKSIRFLSEIFEMVIGRGDKKEGAEPPKQYQLTSQEQELSKLLEQKTSKAGLEINVRIVVMTQDKDGAKEKLQGIVNAFNQYMTYEYGNGFKAQFTNARKKVIQQFIYRFFDEGKSFVLNSEEMTGVFHFPLPQTETPNIKWLLAKKSFAPVGVPTEGIILGKNVYRGQETAIRIKKDDRRRHIYEIGRSGTGKSWLMANLALQDIKNGDGVSVIDPHGDLVTNILQRIPKERADDVILFNPADLERQMGLNLLEFDPRYPEQKTFVINEMIAIFDKLYDLKATGGPIFEQYMRNAMLLIMDDPESGSTLMEISRVLADEDFRRYKLKKSQNVVVKDFWTKEAEKAGGEAALANMVPYITSKLTQFVANDIMRPIIGQQKSAFNLRDVMDQKKILLINLSKGVLGDMNAYLLGMILVGKILMAALSRTDMPEEKRNDFYLYIDEFQNFITDSIAVILSEARKYRLCLTIAHQYIGQLTRGQDTKIKDAVLGTVGTMIAFKIGIEDAEILAKEFAPVFNAYDMVNTDQAYVKLLVDNKPLRPFNMQTLYLPEGNLQIAESIKQLSRLKFSRDRAEIEAEILNRHKFVEEKLEDNDETSEDAEEGNDDKVKDIENKKDILDEL
ncbi:MAG: type IV secretion system DNA-binding domain-containing protein [Parcubacteria group bacterium]|nr:type IV secretion system DNA-binding domain-containing protein [Parcubacteria group bacterium]